MRGIMLEKEVSTKIKKGDMVQISTGKERGKTGKVLQVLKGTNSVLVEKLNLVKRSTKPSQKNPQGGVVEKEAPLNLSKVLLLCSKCNKGVRVGVKVSKDKKVRVCKKCSQEI